MPLVRIKHGPHPAESLEKAVTHLERTGHAVVHYRDFAGEWLVLASEKERARKAEKK